MAGSKLEEVPDKNEKSPSLAEQAFKASYDAESIIVVEATLIAVAAAITATTFVVAAFLEAAASATAIGALLEAAASAAFLFGTAFVDDDLTTVHITAVQGSNGSLGFGVIGHFHKSKAFAPVGEFVGDDFGRSHFAIRSEKIGQVLVFQVPTDVTYVNVHFKKVLKKKKVSTVNETR